jgi:mono/diheme cytochrome c family protein
MSRRSPTLALVLAVALAASGCKRQDMYTQGRYQSWDRNSFFSNGSSMRRPVAGTVARDAPNGPVAQPTAISAAMVARGHERFDIFCSPCHGRAGDGQGMIVQRGFPRPPSFHTDKLRKAKAALFYDTITHGHGAMYSYADRVPPGDRWAVIAYIRALQIGQDAQVAELPAQDRARLDGGGQ